VDNLGAQIRALKDELRGAAHGASGRSAGWRGDAQPARAWWQLHRTQKQDAEEERKEAERTATLARKEKQAALDALLNDAYPKALGIPLLESAASIANIEAETASRELDVAIAERAAARRARGDAEKALAKAAHAMTERERAADAELDACDERIRRMASVLGRAQLEAEFDEQLATERAALHAEHDILATALLKNRESLALKLGALFDAHVECGAEPDERPPFNADIAYAQELRRALLSLRHEAAASLINADARPSPSRAEPDVASLDPELLQPTLSKLSAEAMHAARWEQGLASVGERIAPFTKAAQRTAAVRDASKAALEAA
jgi:hypothetical protein